MSYTKKKRRRENFTTNRTRNKNKPPKNHKTKTNKTKSTNKETPEKLHANHINRNKPRTNTHREQQSKQQKGPLSCGTRATRGRTIKSKTRTRHVPYRLWSENKERTPSEASLLVEIYYIRKIQIGDNAQGHKWKCNLGNCTQQRGNS